MTGYMSLRYHKWVEKTDDHYRAMFSITGEPHKSGVWESVQLFSTEEKAREVLADVITMINVDPKKTEETDISIFFPEFRKVGLEKRVEKPVQVI